MNEVRATLFFYLFEIIFVKQSLHDAKNGDIIAKKMRPIPESFPRKALVDKFKN